MQTSEKKRMSPSSTARRGNAALSLSDVQEVGVRFTDGVAPSRQKFVYLSKKRSCCLRHDSPLLVTRIRIRLFSIGEFAQSERMFRA